MIYLKDVSVSQMDLNDLLKSRCVEILQIAAKHGAHNVHVFGSVARGDAYSQSLQEPPGGASGGRLYTAIYVE